MQYKASWLKIWGNYNCSGFVHVWAWQWAELKMIRELYDVKVTDRLMCNDDR